MSKSGHWQATRFRFTIHGSPIQKLGSASPRFHHPPILPPPYAYPGRGEPVCRRTCSGISLFINSGGAPANCDNNEQLINYHYHIDFGDKNEGTSEIIIDLVNNYSQYHQHMLIIKYRHQKLRHTSCLKLNRGGNGRPFGRRALGSRSSSKKGWTHASNCRTIEERKQGQIHMLLEN